MAETKKVPLTKKAFERLKEELKYLEGEGHDKIVQEIATARAHGDLSENAEYHAAKDQQGLQEARRRQIKEMIENAEIITGDDEDVVKAGKVVTIRHEGEEPETYLLGMREEKGGEFDILTPDSPLGKVLIGKTAGDTVTAKAPAGDRKIEIVAVRSL